MRAILRWNNSIAAGLLLVAAPASAQGTPEQASSSAAQNYAVGPQELQNFRLPGSVTKPADQPADLAPTTVKARTSAAKDDALASLAPKHSRDRSAASDASQAKVAARTARIAGAASGDLPASSARTIDALSVPISSSARQEIAQTSAPAASLSDVPTPAALSPEHRLLIWPWILAALALAAGSMLLLWLRRPHEAFARRRTVDRLVAPDVDRAPPPSAPVAARAPAPRPSPEPTAPRTSPPAGPPRGIVSSRLRPMLEVSIRPIRFLLEDQQVAVEFELELFNSGAAPAREVLVEASLLNAGASREEQLAAFFANPVGAGERVLVIAPMSRMSFNNQLVAPRSALEEYELRGRKIFVPVLAINALYSWSGGGSQTSAAFLVGRETSGEKLGPLTLDGGPREVVRLAARLLPATVRT